MILYVIKSSFKILWQMFDFFEPQYNFFPKSYFQTVKNLYKSDNFSNDPFHCERVC